MNRRKTLLQSLGARTDYVMNPDKTDGGLLVSSYECDPASAEVDFLLSKQQYQMITGRQPKHGKDVIAYHVRQAFYPGEITPEEANRIGYELAMQFTGGRHQFIVATFIDKAHVHNHVIINSTTLDCMHKFNNVKDSADLLRDISDRLCLEKGYSVITEPEEKGKGYEQWAKVFNLKQMASAMCILREEGITSTGQMGEKLAAAISDFEQASDQLKETESEIRELRKMKQHILDYGRTREIYAEYQRRGTSDDYLEVHRAEIQIHLAAKKAFEEFKPKRVPKLKDLNARLSVLSDRQKSQYEQYRKARNEMQRWQAVRQSMESSLNRLEKEKHRGVSR